MSNNPFSNNPQPPGGPQNPYAQPKQNPMGGAKGPKPKNYLVESIILLICCGGIFAIPAIVFAAQVDSKYNSGDFAGAQKAADNAKLWCIIALCIGLVCNGTLIAIQIFAIAAEGGGF